MFPGIIELNQSFAVSILDSLPVQLHGIADPDKSLPGSEYIPLDGENIRQLHMYDYYVYATSEDGNRLLLYANKSPRSLSFYLVDKMCRVYSIPNELIHEQLFSNNSLLEIEASTKDGKILFEAFDLILLQGVTLKNYDYKERLQCLQSYMASLHRRVNQNQKTIRLDQKSIVKSFEYPSLLASDYGMSGSFASFVFKNSADMLFGNVLKMSNLSWSPASYPFVHLLIRRHDSRPHCYNVFAQDNFSKECFVQTCNLGDSNYSERIYNLCSQPRIGEFAFQPDSTSRPISATAYLCHGGKFMPTEVSNNPYPEISSVSRVRAHQLLRQSNLSSSEVFSQTKQIASEWKERAKLLYRIKANQRPKEKMMADQISEPQVFLTAAYSKHVEDSRCKTPQVNFIKEIPDYESMTSAEQEQFVPASITQKSITLSNIQPDDCSALVDSAAKNGFDLLLTAAEKKNSIPRRFKDETKKRRTDDDTSYNGSQFGGIEYCLPSILSGSNPLAILPKRGRPSKQSKTDTKILLPKIMPN